MRSVGEGAATGVFALGFASGVTGARMVGVEGVLWRRALTVGRDVEGEGWGRRDISREDSTMGHGGLRWRINQRNRMLDLVNSTVPSALAPIMEVGVGPRGAPQVPAGGLLFHVARRAPMLVHNSGCPETPYRSRSDFKTNRKAPPPLHANVSVQIVFMTLGEAMGVVWTRWERCNGLDGRERDWMTDWGSGAVMD